MTGMWREPYRPLSDDPRTMGLFQFAPTQPMVARVSIEDEIRRAMPYIVAIYGQPRARLRPPWWARAVAWGIVVYCAVSR